MPTCWRCAGRPRTGLATRRQPRPSLAVSSWLLPTGVNNVFVTRFAKYLIPASALLFIAFFSAVYIGDIKLQFFNTQDTGLSAYDFTLLLLPLTPVAQYIINNNEILSKLPNRFNPHSFKEIWFVSTSNVLGVGIYNFNNKHATDECTVCLA